MDIRSYTNYPAPAIGSTRERSSVPLVYRLRQADQPQLSWSGWPLSPAAPDHSGHMANLFEVTSLQNDGLSEYKMKNFVSA